MQRAECGMQRDKEKKMRGVGVGKTEILFSVAGIVKANERTYIYIYIYTLLVAAVSMIADHPR